MTRGLGAPTPTSAPEATDGTGGPAVTGSVAPFSGDDSPEEDARRNQIPDHMLSTMIGGGEITPEQALELARAGRIRRTRDPRTIPPKSYETAWFDAEDLVASGSWLPRALREAGREDLWPDFAEALGYPVEDPMAGDGSD